MIFKSLTKHSNARILIEKERIDLSKKNGNTEIVYGVIRLICKFLAETFISNRSKVMKRID